VRKPRIAIGPVQRESTVRAVEEAGGEVVPADGAAQGLVWLDPADVAGLRAALADAPAAGWVQLPFAGIERVAAAGLLAPGRTWTCAKGAYAEPVAEHALMLAMAGLRGLPARITARSWGKAAGESLYDQPVTILGGGGIAASLISLLTPMRARVTVVRRQAGEVPGAALRDRVIGGAALDVTDPEPLPDGHPLWDLDNCIITPYTADTDEMIERMLNLRIGHNVAAFAAGQPLAGLVDVAAGY
jgi:phosphoglycerate dehydrogenase-like enzyme